MFKNEKGFTLIELMIVIAIIGILAAVAIPQFASYRIKGFNTSALSDIRNLNASQATFFSDYFVYGVSGKRKTTDAVTGFAGGIPSAEDGLISGPMTGGEIAVIRSTTNATTPENKDAVIPLGNGVGLFAYTNAATGAGGSDPVASDANTSFIGLSKHTGGNTYFGIDDASSAIYACEVKKNAGIPLRATDGPEASKPAVDDFNDENLTSPVGAEGGEKWSVR